MQSYFSLPPGGRWHFRKKMPEGARGIIIYRSPQNECFAFVHAGSLTRLCRELPLGGSLEIKALIFIFYLCFPFSFDSKK